MMTVDQKNEIKQRGSMAIDSNVALGSYAWRLQAYADDERANLVCCNEGVDFYAELTISQWENLYEHTAWDAVGAQSANDSANVEAANRWVNGRSFAWYRLSSDGRKFVEVGEY